MSESPGPASPSPKPERSALHQRLDRLVSRAQWTLLWERAWPRIWLPITILLVFLSASWLGLWVDASPLMRTSGMGLFTAAFILSLWPLTRLRLPGRTSALDRLDRDTGLPHGPARALDDTLALGQNDPGSRALWDLHRRRSETAIAKLRVSAPRPDMPQRDRFAVRAAAVLAMVASAFVAGPELGSRLGAAFDWREPKPAAANFRVDGWIDPPLYTRTPPLMIDLAGGEQRLRAPVRSTVVIRVAGEGDVAISPGPGLTAQPAPDNQRAGLREQRFTLDGDAELQVKTGLASGVRLRVEAIPDKAPEIAWVSPPEVNQRGAFTLVYKGRDDYAITAAEGTVEKGEALTGKRTLVPAPTLPVAIPDTSSEEAETRAPVDLTTHPWAGARVKLTLVARDDAGQEGRSQSIDFTLPQRPFTKPLAKSLVEQRRKLVLDPDDRRRVQVALDALLIAPDTFTKEWGVFLGLRTAAERLRRAKGDPELVEVADWLWAMAVQIEDGDLSDAERDLRAAQDRLREAMERNASPDEIQRLMNELRQAMDKFLREFAERMQRQQQQGENSPNSQQPERTITQNDLNRMLQEMEQAMRRGDMAEAQRLLEELRNIMENLQTAQRGNRMSDPMAREMQRSMEDLEAMAREQQQLRDETFREGQQRRMQQGQRGQRQQQGQRGQQGQRQRGQQGQQGEGEEQAENGEQGQQGQQGQGQGQGLSQRQQALRERLQELQRRMRGMGMQGEQGLGEAEQAMREAEGALGQGQDGPAVDAQGRALEGLQRGMQGMAQQMQQMMQPGDGSEEAGNEPGQGDPMGRGQASQRDTDPLGRPTRSRDFMDNSRVQVPRAGESPSQRAQRILEELRRKLGEATRPREELEYFERLLRPR